MEPNLIDLAQEYGLKLQKRSNLYRTSCCFHKEKDASLFFYPETNSFHCFGCETSGGVVQFVKLIKNISYQEALQELGMEGDKYNLSALRKRLEEERPEDPQNILKSYYLLANKLLLDKGFSLELQGQKLDKLFSSNDIEGIKAFIEDLSKV